MDKKYIVISLVFLSFLASCGSENSSVSGTGAEQTIVTQIDTPTETIKSNEDIISDSEAPQNNVVEPIKEEIQEIIVPTKEEQSSPAIVEEETTPEPVVVQEVQPATKVQTLTQSYSVPEGKTETVEFTLTLDGDTITKISTTGVGRLDRESQQYVNRFVSSSGGKIVGLTLAQAKNISTVGGASLTTGAFKTALKNM